VEKISGSVCDSVKSPCAGHYFNYFSKAFDFPFIFSKNGFSRPPILWRKRPLLLLICLLASIKGSSRSMSKWIKSQENVLLEGPQAYDANCGRLVEASYLCLTAFLFLSSRKIQGGCR